MDCWLSTKMAIEIFDIACVCDDARELARSLDMALRA